ncbi:aminoglycoside phosphotransferase family protein, partial [Bacillus sporothermodurans]|nr:aminoglycoside phosphotransferase family protein [Heyndrickxia sporothermodurans]
KVVGCVVTSIILRFRGVAIFLLKNPSIKVVYSLFYIKVLTKRPELWGAVFDFVREPRPQVKPCFIHRDYHPTNILWVDDKVSGVVDWVNACRGPAGIDIGHCRLNLAMLFGVSTADEFLSAYEKLAGYSFSYHPYWDLLSLIDILFGSPEVYPGWIAFGVTNLTDQMMVDRLDQYMKSLLKKI